MVRCWVAKRKGGVWCVLESMFSGLGSNNDEGDIEVRSAL